MQRSSSAALRFSEFIGEDPLPPPCKKYSDAVDLIDRYGARLNSKDDSKRQQVPAQQQTGDLALKASNSARGELGKTKHGLQGIPIFKIGPEARAEIESLEKRLHVNKEVKVHVSGKQSERVLISLSAADQVAELERIITGLKNNTFNKEQLALIHDEVTSLSDSVAAAMQQTAGQTGNADPLLQLRDSHLAEVQELLGFS